MSGLAEGGAAHSEMECTHPANIDVFEILRVHIQNVMANGNVMSGDLQPERRERSLQWPEPTNNSNANLPRANLHFKNVEICEHEDLTNESETPSPPMLDVIRCCNGTKLAPT